MLTEESEFPEIRRLVAINEITGENQVRAVLNMLKDSGQQDKSFFSSLRNELVTKVLCREVMKEQVDFTA